jgi:hypothetical protein
MKSAVATRARDAREAREAAMTPTERVELALALGKRACALFAAGQGLTFEEARRVLEERKRAGARECRSGRAVRGQ